MTAAPRPLIRMAEGRLSTCKGLNLARSPCGACWLCKEARLLRAADAVIEGLATTTYEWEQCQFCGAIEESHGDGRYVTHESGCVYGAYRAAEKEVQGHDAG